MFGLHRRSSKEKPPRHSASQTPFKYLLNNFDEFVSVQEKPKRRLLQFDVQEFCDNFEKGMMKALKDASKIHEKSTSTRAPAADPSLFITEKTQGPIFDEEDGSGPVFDEEAPSINMDSHLCFDPGTTPPLLSTDIQELCEKLDLIYSLPELFVGISSHNVKSFGLENVKEFCVSNSIFDNMIHSFEKLEPDKLFDQKRFLNDNDISSGLVLSFDQFLKHHKGFDHLEKSFELVLQQSDFCFRKPCDYFVCFKDNWFDLSFSSHGLITGDLFAFPCALDEFMVKTLLEQKSLRTETDSCCDSDLKPAPSYFESDLDLMFLCSEYDQPRLVLNMFYGVSCLESILICNTFFEKHIEPWKSNSQFELDLLCSKSEKLVHVVKLFFRNYEITSLDTILFCNVYFDVHLDRLKCVQLVLGKYSLISDLHKYMSCTYDPGILMFVLSVQDKQVQPQRRESIDHSRQPEIWRCIDTSTQTGYLGDASDTGSVQSKYLGVQKVFRLDSNFPGKPTPQGFTEAWNHLKSFTEEGDMNFLIRRFSSPSIREYKISKGDSCPRRERPEPKPILHEPEVFPQSTTCPNQKHCEDHGLIVSTLHENVLKPRISKQKQVFTWLKNVLLKPFHELFSLSCALKEIWCRNKHEPKLLRPKNSFDFVHDENFTNLALSHSFPSSFTPWPDFEFDKPIFGTQFTCLMLDHMLDDYPKSLDPVFDVLRIEKPFDYFFVRFDVVSLVVLNEQDKHDHFSRRASTDGCQRTWNYLWETISNHQGSFCPNFPFTDFFLNFNSSESDLFPFGTGTIDLRTNPFEEEGNDATQDPDQDQLNDQDAQIRPTEVHPSVQAKQSNRAVNRINSRLSGKELRLDPRPDDRSDRTTDDLSRPTRQDKANRRARLHLEQSESDHDRNFSLLTRLVRTAHPDDRTNVLTSSFDAIKDFSSTKFSKARILRLSEDLGRVKSSYVQDSSMITPAAAPPFVHLLTATNQIITDALGHISESGPVNL